MASRDPLRILCLDGGGVKGLSSLHIVKELMDQTRREEELSGPANAKPIRPYEYFDVICGTGTGGLIAIMLGRLQYDIDTAIEKYVELTEAVFETTPPDSRALFDHVALEKEIRKIIETAPDGSKADALFEDPRVKLNLNYCRTFVLALRPEGSGNAAVRMRTYGTIENDPFKAQIWQVARATSAAPTYFLPINISNIVYGDGRTGWNNPTSEAISEAEYIWPSRPIGCLVSVGTGLDDANQLAVDAIRPSSRGILGSMLRSLTPSDPRQAYEIAVAQYCVNCATSCQRVHEEVARNWARFDMGGQWKYIRLNVAQGMAKIGLQEWKRLQMIAALTADYMESFDVRELKRQAAKRLITPTIYFNPASPISPGSESRVSEKSRNMVYPRLIKAREQGLINSKNSSALVSSSSDQGSSASSALVRQPQITAVRKAAHNRWKAEELDSSSDESGARWEQYFEGTSLGLQAPLADDAYSYRSRRGYVHPTQMPKPSDPSAWVYPKRQAPSAGHSRAQSSVRSEEERTFDIEVEAAPEADVEFSCDYAQCKSKICGAEKEIRHHYVKVHLEDLIKPSASIPAAVSGTRPRWWRCWSCLHKIQPDTPGQVCRKCDTSSGALEIAARLGISSLAGKGKPSFLPTEPSTMKSEPIMLGGLVVNGSPEQEIWVPPELPAHWTSYTPTSSRHINTGVQVKSRSGKPSFTRNDNNGKHAAGDWRRRRGGHYQVDEMSRHVV